MHTRHVGTVLLMLLLTWGTAGCGASIESLHTPDDQDLVVVLGDVGGKCAKVAGPNRAFVRPKEKVTWHFENYCDELRDVQIELAVSINADPFTDITPGRRIPRLPGKNLVGTPGRGKIEVHTKGERPLNEKGPTLYSYTIRSSAGALDPEIIVDWP